MKHSVPYYVFGLPPSSLLDWRVCTTDEKTGNNAEEADNYVAGRAAPLLDDTFVGKRRQY